MEKLEVEIIVVFEYLFNHHKYSCNMKALKHIRILIALMLFCFALQTFAQETGKASIYIKRPAFVGAAWVHYLEINGVYIGQVKGGDCVKINVDPGTYVLSYYNGALISFEQAKQNGPDFTIPRMLNAGDNLYVQIKIKATGPSYVIEDDGKGFSKYMEKDFAILQQMSADNQMVAGSNNVQGKTSVQQQQVVTQPVVTQEPAATPKPVEQPSQTGVAQETEKASIFVKCPITAGTLDINGVTMPVRAKGCYKINVEPGAYVLSWYGDSNGQLPLELAKQMGSYCTTLPRMLNAGDNMYTQIKGRFGALTFVMDDNGKDFSKYEETDLSLLQQMSGNNQMVAGNNNVQGATSVQPQPVVTREPAVAQKPVEKPSRTGVAAKVESDVDVNIPSTSAKADNTFVLIIANEEYQFLDNVNYAAHDGEVFKEYCTKTLGVPERQVRYCPNASFGIISGGVDWLRYALDNFEGSRGIVYYCGHGIPDEKTNEAYIIPVDGKGTNTATCYSLNNLYKTLSKTKASNITYFFDACFTGANKEGSMLVAARGVAREPKKETLSGKAVVFSASSGDETAMTYEEKGHGLFTYYLLKKIQETKGDVSYQDLAEYISKNVKKDAFLLNEKPQNPVVATSPGATSTWKNLKLK